jgi:hypothetical protein
MSDGTAKDSLLQVLKESQAFNQAFLDQLTEEDRAKQGKDDDWYWAPKDAVAHVAYWIDATADRLEHAAAGTTPTREWDNFLEVNKRVFEERKDLAWPQVTDLLHKAEARLYASVSALSEADLLEKGRVSWQSSPALGTTAADVGVVHTTLHFADVHAAKGDVAGGKAYFERMAMMLNAPALARSLGYLHYELAGYLVRADQHEEAAQALAAGTKALPSLVKWVAEGERFALLRATKTYQDLLASSN